METLNPHKCKDCILCRLDLVKRVKIAEKVNDYTETIDAKYADRNYCGHKVGLVNPEAPACGFIKPRQI